MAKFIIILESQCRLWICALELISLAEKYEGRLIPLETPKGLGEFVYFKVIFKNKANYEKFLKDVRNKSS